MSSEESSSESEREFNENPENEEEEGDESEEVEERPGKKSRPFNANPFLDIEAEVDDDEEGEEDEEYDDEGFVEDGGAPVTIDTSIYRRSLPRKEDTRSAEEIARDLTRRHRNYTEPEDEVEDFEEEGTNRIKQQSLLPSVKDPKLWMVKCKIGKERQLVVSLMQKYLDTEGTPEALSIKSAVAPDHLKGYLYVEAEKQVYVEQAIKGLRNLQQWGVKMVPIKEMPDVLAVATQHVVLKRGDWVRIQRGLYRGDLGQVYEVDEGRGQVTVKLIPRLEYKKQEPPQDKDGKRKRAIRPPARFFNPDESNAKDRLDRRLDPHTKEAYYVFEGHKFKDGYLLKTMNVKSLDAHNVVPSLEELQKFQDRSADAEDDTPGQIAVGNLKQKRKVNFVKGDTVKVISGDLKHLVGVVDSVNDTTVYMMPKHPDLNELLQFPIAQLQKVFDTGAHVKVVNGVYEGETGLIVKINPTSVVVFSDLTKKEIEVLPQDIQECSDVTTGKVQLGNYQIHDLVQINPQTVGMIVKIEPDTFKILDNNGNIQSVRMQEMGSKRRHESQAFDSQQNPLSVGDVLKVTEGPSKGKQGTIKHLFKYFAFLQCRDVLENSGIIVVRTGNCELLGGRKAAPGTLRESAPPSPSPFAGLRSPARSPVDQRGTRSRFDAPPRIQRGRRDDSFISKTVMIKSGQWKGYVGIVKDATDTNVRVELHTNCKVVTVPKNNVIIKDGGQAPHKIIDTAYVPDGSQTPMRPDYDGARTPMRDYDGARTPMRDYDGARTPMRDYDGSQTPLRVPGTPSRSDSAWDPRMPNTPIRPWSDSSEVPITPGGYAPVYPPYSPAVRSHYEQPNNPPTPASAFTPGPRTPQDVSTPFSGTPYSQATSTPTTPMTPGSEPLTPRTPGTPTGGEFESSEMDDSNWFTPDIGVKIKSDTFHGGRYLNAKGVIREVGQDTCRVVLDGSEETLVVPCDALDPVVPSQKGNVKIIRGDLKGNVGTLIGIDGGDGIVKMSSNLDIKILNLNLLATHFPNK